MLLQLASLLTAIVGALSVSAPNIPRSPLPVPRVNMPELTAASSFLVDTRQEHILSSKNPDVTLPLASITKLMTALVVLDRAPDWKRQVVVTERDMRRGDITRLVPGEEITLGDAWHLMLIAS